MEPWLVVVVAFTLIFGFVVFRGAPYVPSQRRFILQAFEKLYRLKKDDVLIDLGSGDGIVLRIAAPRVRRVVGYELNPMLVIISRFLLRKQKNVQIQLTDFWLKSLPDDVTIIYTFAVSRDMPKLSRYLRSEATRLGRPLILLCYGSAPSDLTMIGEDGAYRLYRVSPLQS